MTPRSKAGAQPVAVEILLAAAQHLLDLVLALVELGRSAALRDQRVHLVEQHLLLLHRLGRQPAHVLRLLGQRARTPDW